jgi:uncharacterized membrane protein
LFGCSLYFNLIKRNRNKFKTELLRRGSNLIRMVILRSRRAKRNGLELYGFILIFHTITLPFRFFVFLFFLFIISFLHLLFPKDLNDFLLVCKEYPISCLVVLIVFPCVHGNLRCNATFIDILNSLEDDRTTRNERKRLYSKS